MSHNSLPTIYIGPIRSTGPERQHVSRRVVGERTNPAIRRVRLLALLRSRCLIDSLFVRLLVRLPVLSDLYSGGVKVKSREGRLVSAVYYICSFVRL